MKRHQANRLLADLEANHNDGTVARKLKKAGAYDLVTGKELPTYVYRLVCGHLVPIITVPLPSTTLSLWCERDGCRRHRDIAERLT